MFKLSKPLNEKFGLRLAYKILSMHDVSIHNYEKHIETLFSLLYFIKIMIHLAWEANFMLIFNQASIKLSKGFRAGEENKKLEEKNEAGYTVESHLSGTSI